MTIMRRSTVFLGAAMALSLASSCSNEPGSAEGAESSANAQGVETDEASAALLPDGMQSESSIHIVMDATQGQPFTYFEDGDEEMTGITADLADAIAQALGVEIEFSNVPFDGLITGLEAQRYELSIAPMLMTEERLQKVDMVGFLKGGSRFIVTKDSEYVDLTLDEVCGLSVGASTGSVEAQALADQSAKCQEEGRDAVDVNLFPRTSEGIVALTSGRLDAYDAASAQAGFIANQEGRLTASGDPYNSGISSMALPKDSEVSEAVESALQYLIDEGTYLEILEKYGVEDLAVPAASLNEPAE